MNDGQIGAKFTKVKANHSCHRTKFFERKVSLATLDSADVAAVDVGFKREVFLRHPQVLPCRSNPLAEHLERSLLFQP